MSKGSHPLVLIHSAGKGGHHQLEQVKLWKGFLEYERSNPQRLDITALTQRVELAYMQALMCLLHFPEVRDSGCREGWGFRPAQLCSGWKESREDW
jgi:hypothetical protein